MSVKALSEYTIYSKYAKHLPERARRETWREQVERVFAMHERKYASALENAEFRELFEFGKNAVIKKITLGSQRSLQFGGAAIEKHNDKMYNCAVTYIDRPEVFSHIMYMLLCGCGVGFSVQKHHIAKLPKASTPSGAKQIFVIPDSIEGWADGFNALMRSYFGDTGVVEFDYSQIRPRGAPIAGGFKAPGPDGLRMAFDKIRALIDSRVSEGLALRPIDYYDIIMHASDAVLSGGVRRSATICVFSPDDTEMLNAKVGDWFYVNPQRGRSNNSVMLLRNETSREHFDQIMKSVKSCGEPGFVWSDDIDILFNPCVEIGFYPKRKSDGASGVQYCNLTEINGKKCNTPEDFYEACKASAIIGTLQAGYTSFPYLGKVTEDIVREEALLGCSITGMMDNYEVLFNPEVQRCGAEIVKETNKIVAKMIGINPAARTTCVKPAGTTSCVLGTASGIHPQHAKRYLRRTQANELEFPLQEIRRTNPLMVEKSVWSNNSSDASITFRCEVPPGAIVKNQLSACEFLDCVKLTQQNWVEYGTNLERCVNPVVRHNVSNTITVNENEWDEVATYIYDNRKWFAGISLLPASGDLDYPQAPFCTVLTPAEIVKKYGDASVFASGLIVDAAKAFEDNLWVACDHVLPNEKCDGYVRPKPVAPSEPDYPKTRNFAALASYFAQREAYEKVSLQLDWIRRALQFADRYFKSDVREMTYCLKNVHNWKYWCDLERTHVDIDWSTVVETTETLVDVSTNAAQACAGGKCDLV